MRAVRAAATIVTTDYLGDVRAQRPVRARAVDADEYTVVEHRPRRILRRALGASAVARPCAESLPAPLLLVPRELRHRDRLCPLAERAKHNERSAAIATRKQLARDGAQVKGETGCRLVKFRSRGLDAGPPPSRGQPEHRTR